MTYEEYAQMRDMRGLKDVEVARRAHIGASTFSDWKSGRSLPKEDKLRKIAAALDMTIKQFMGWDIDVPEESKEYLYDLAEIELVKATEDAIAVDVKRIAAKLVKLSEDQQNAIECVIDQFIKDKEV